MVQQRSREIATRNLYQSEFPSIQGEGHNNKNSTIENSVPISVNLRSLIKPGDIDQEKVHTNYRAMENSVLISVHSRSLTIKAGEMFDMLERLVNLLVKIAFCIYVYKYINSNASH